MLENTEFEPTRLAIARRRRGMARAELAVKSGIKARTITAYEQGARSPSAESLQDLARALAFPVEFFWRRSVENLSWDTVSFRALSKTAAARREQALSAGDLALELTAWVEDRFALPKPDVPDLHPPPSPEAAAASVRAAWGLGDRPIPSVVQLLEARGVRVFSLAEDTTEIDAFSFWHAGTPFVFLNTLKSAERSRFDAAHELGHLVLHRHGSPMGRPAEREANSFASSFLMPRSSVLAHAPRRPLLRDLVEAKRGWGVSVAALAYRLRELGLLTEWQYVTLSQQIQTSGFRTTEPNSMPRELSAIWSQVFSDLRREGISGPEIARQLAWPVSELKSLVFQLVLSAQSGSSSSLVAKMTTHNDRAALRIVT